MHSHPETIRMSILVYPKVRGCNETDGDDSRWSDAGGSSAERDRDCKGKSGGILLLYYYIHSVIGMLCSVQR